MSIDRATSPSLYKDTGWRPDGFDWWDGEESSGSGLATAFLVLAAVGSIATFVLIVWYWMHEGFPPIDAPS